MVGQVLGRGKFSPSGRWSKNGRNIIVISVYGYFVEYLARLTGTKFVPRDLCEMCKVTQIDNVLKIQNPLIASVLKM